MLRCWNCGKVTGIVGRPSRADDCPFCRVELRSCRGCRFYEPVRASQCSEPKAEAPVEKDKVNFCDYFVAGEFTAKETEEARPTVVNVTSARAALDKLFQK